MIYLTLIWKLFRTFFKIGLFGFGGGYSMISLLEYELIKKHMWIDQCRFTDIISVSQITPGPVGINFASYLGYDVMFNAGGGHFLGILASLITTLAIILPSLLLVIVLTKVYQKYSTSLIFKGSLNYLKACVIGLIAATMFNLIFDVSLETTFWGVPQVQFSIVEENFGSAKSWIYFFIAFISSYFFKLSPVYIILFFSIVGFII